MVPRRYADYVAFAQTGMLYLQAYRDPVAPFTGSFDWTKPFPNLRLLAAAGVSRIVTWDAAGNRLKSDRVTGALPRAYVVHGIRAARQPADTLKSIADGDLDATRETILEGVPPGAEAPASPVERGERALITHYEPNAVDIEVTLKRPGALVLLDAEYPGWRAYVNDQPTPIYNANFLFRSVLLRPGTHRVSFRYAPTSFWIGILGGVIGFVAVAGLLLASCFGRQSRARAMCGETQRVHAKL